MDGWVRGPPVLTSRALIVPRVDPPGAGHFIIISSAPCIRNVRALNRCPHARELMPSHALLLDPSLLANAPLPFPGYA